MVNACCAYNCKQRFSSNLSISFHSFPLSKGKEEILQEWIKNIRREHFTPTRYSRVCSLHFEQTCFEMGSDRKRNLRPWAVPTIFDFPSNLQMPNKQKRINPRKRLKEGDPESDFPSQLQMLKQEKINIPQKRLKEDDPVPGFPSHLQMLNKEKRSNPGEDDPDPSFVHLYDHPYTSIRVEENTEPKAGSVKYQSLKEALSELRNTNLLCKDMEEYIESSFSGLALEILRNKLGNIKDKCEERQYSEEIKSFTFTLFYHCPKAYKYLRQYFCLPGETIIRAMLSNVNCDPGFTTASIDYLRSIQTKDPANKYFTLMLDGMNIMQHVEWDATSNKFLGYVNYGEGTPQGDDQPVATEALVLMAVGSFRPFKVPLGYFLINGITGTTLAMLVTESIRLLHNLDMQCIAVVSDGFPANLSMARELGCNFIPGNPMKTYFPNPSVPGHRVYFMLDVCHVFKLMRNLLAREKKLKQPGLGVIEWRFLEYLVEQQKSEGLHCATKIQRKHLNWQNEKMNVSIAAQTLSSSVSEALLLMKRPDRPQFKDAEPTSKWIQNLSWLFEALNSRNPRAVGSKAPLSPSNHKFWHPFLEKMAKNLLQLELMNGEKVVDTPKKTGVLGFIITIKSFLALYNDIFHEKKFGSINIKYIMTYKFSQDHLELLFNCIRGRSGWCNNPTVMQFHSAYRYIICRVCDVKLPSTQSIAADNTSGKTRRNVRHVKMLIKIPVNRDHDYADKVTRLSLRVHLKPSCIRNSLGKPRHNMTLEEMLINIPVNQDHDYADIPNLTKLSLYVDNVVGHIASFVVRGVRRTVACDDCIAVLTRAKPSKGGNFSLIHMKNDDCLVYPSHDLLTLLQYAEQDVRPLLKTVELPSNAIIQSSKNDVMMRALRNKLFSSLDAHSADTSYEDQNHVFTLMKLCLQSYYNVRMHQAAREKTAQLIVKCL